MKIVPILFLSTIFLFISCNSNHENLKEGIYAEIETAKGTLIAKLEYQKVPYTVANFITLAEGKNPFVSATFKNKPFYDGLKFHRVIPDFMIQGGDPNGDGTGGPGYKFEDEFHTDLKHSKKGILAMANAGAGTNGSQFYITHKETPWLDNRHTVFGEIIEGLDLIETIESYDAIEKITIIRIGEQAKKFDALKIFSDYYSKVAEKQKIDEANFRKITEAKVKEITALKAIGSKSNSGLIYEIVSKGNGAKPKAGSRIYINYTGYLENGMQFDTTIEQSAKEFGAFNSGKAAQNGYVPYQAEMGNLQFIPGFVEGLNMLNFGGKAKLYIPSNLAYGAEGAGGIIPPNAAIYFEIELLEKQ